MTDIIFTDAINNRIARDFVFSEDPDHPGHVRAYNSVRGLYLRWAFPNEDAARGFIASILKEEDSIESKKTNEIDPRIRIVVDFEGDWVINLQGPASFGTFDSAEDALPLASDMSRLMIDEDYYSDPEDPAAEE